MVDQITEFSYAARSDVGLLRKNNQDSGYAGPHLLVLADGMGGPAGGDIASSVAVAHLAPLDNESCPADEMLSLLRAAFFSAQDELSHRSKVDPSLQGLGTTCIAIMKSGNKLAMLHIGDSRAYILRDGSLTQVTTDHSFVQYLVDSGQITPEEAEHHPQRNVVLKVLGDSDKFVAPDETIREAILGDRWLLCSDGLSGVVSPETIESVLTEIKNPDECAEELIRLALLGGGPDNITCIIADVVGSGESKQLTPQIVGAAANDHKTPTRGGKGAAAKAAQLTKSKNPATSDPHESDTPPEPHKRHWMLPFIALLILAVLGFGSWAGYTWSQSQYYVKAESNHVTIYQGIPQTIGKWRLSHPVQTTDIAVSALTPMEQDRLKEPVVRSSRAEIDSYISQLKSGIRPAHGKEDPQSSPQSLPAIPLSSSLPSKIEVDTLSSSSPSYATLHGALFSADAADSWH